MQINIEKLQTNIVEYNKILENYENTYQNYYHEIQNAENYWKSSTANYFFNIIEEEKKECQKFYEELHSLKLVFDYLIDSYQNIGKKLFFNPQKKDTAINKINDYQIKDILNLYNNLDLSIAKEKKLIEDQNLKMQEIEKKVIQYKESLTEKYNTIEKIENEVKRRLAKIEISPIEENSSTNHSLGITEKSSMNIEELDNSIKKINMYKEAEDLNFENIKETFRSINYNYITDNKTKLESLELEIINKYKIILINHNNNIKLLNDNVEKATNALRKANNILDKMNGEKA